MNDLDILVQQVKQSTDFQVNKKILNEKIKTDLHITYNNGLFLVTVELLAFLATWPEDELYLADTFENPIKINRTEFLSNCREQYQTVMNRWHLNYEELKKIRKI